jgi:hypothetical protein
MCHVWQFPTPSPPDGFFGCDALVMPFKVSIVPENSGMEFNTHDDKIMASRPIEGIHRSISAGAGAQTFYVVLTNTSDLPQYVWETWNMWGFQTVSLEATTAAGKTYRMTVKSRPFTMNFPSTFMIPPGEQEVFPIHLDQEWEGRPAKNPAGCCTLPSDTELVHVTVRAVYEVHPSDEAFAYGVWTGRVVSRPYELDLHRYDDLPDSR